MFVIDSTDRARFEEAKVELITALKDEQLAKAAVLILANKHDKVDAMPVEEILQKLNGDDANEADVSLSKILNGRDFKVIAGSALKDFGVHDGFEWLCTVMKPLA